MRFIPPFDTIAACAFHIFAAVTHKTGEVTVGAAVAKSVEEVPLALIRALVGFPKAEELQPIHLEVVASCCSGFSDPAAWIMSDVTQLPAVATIEVVDDAGAVITVVFSPIIDLVEDGSAIDMTLVGTVQTVGEALLSSLLGRAEVEYVVPFAGTADAATWAAIVNATLDGDRNTLVRLAPQGYYKELASQFEPATTDGDTSVEVELCFNLIPGSDLENEVIRICDACDEVSIRRLPGNNTVIRVSTTKEEVMRILDWTSDHFIAVKMSGSPE